MTNSEGPAEVAERGKWGRQIEFFLSLLGYSVGIGNIVRFPYLCLKNGGGAFVVPFFLAHLLCGIPLFILELLLGQFSGLSPFTLWNFCPLFKGIGYSMAAISGVISIYYNMLLAYCLFYLFSSFTLDVPWQACGNTWNSESCWDGNTRFSNSTLFEGNVTTQVNFSKNFTWASDEFWQNRVLGLSKSFDDIGAFRWELVLCLLGAWMLVFLSLAWGVKWSGKVVYVTATLPYVLLTALVIRGCTLDGASLGLYYYAFPDFRKLLLSETWVLATIQMFYSLGPAWGGLITMSSYNPFRHNCIREGIVAPCLDMVTALFGGLAIFSIIGFMSAQSGLSIEDVAKSGPGLSFVVYPLALAKLPFAPAWSAVFFLTLITLGIDSMFGTFETVLSGLFDAWPSLRKHNMLVVGITCLIFFAMGLIFCTNGGMYYYVLIDWYSAVITVPLIALFEVIAVCFIYGLPRFSEDVKLMLGKPPALILKALWLVATPIILILVLVVGLIDLTPPSLGLYKYPAYAHYLGLVVAISTTLPMPVTAVWVIYKAVPEKYPSDAPDGALRRAWFTFVSKIKFACAPNDDWVPQDRDLRDEYRRLRDPTTKDAHRLSDNNNRAPLIVPINAADGYVAEEKL